ncbi:hypothetical protein KR059_004852 [Drosophila kikkawai]|nr:hypothetical protein KR059_004852 [Drosophila kikkawai]
MNDKKNKPNWAVEAVDPPPGGGGSFPTFNTQRDSRILRRNPQFENEPVPMLPPIKPLIAPIAPIGNRSEPSSRRSQNPDKFQRSKNLNTDAKPGRRFSPQRDGV